MSRVILESVLMAFLALAVGTVYYMCCEPEDNTSLESPSTQARPGRDHEDSRQSGNIDRDETQLSGK